MSDEQPEAWRDLPPTYEQEKVLRRWARIRGERYPVMPKTRGEASDHISAVVADAKRRDEADAFDPPNDWDDQPRDWGDL